MPMKFHAPTRTFVVDQEGFQRAAGGFLFAMKMIRELGELPLDKYQRNGLLTNADRAQKAIIDAAAALGIDLGAQQGNELDLREAG